MQPVYDMTVYKQAEQLADMIWNDFDSWPTKAQRTIGYQIIRSADSISANIEEGYGRYTPADRKRFYIIARGSFEETKTWLRKAIRRKVISDPSRIEEYRQLIDSLGPILNGFIRSTKAPDS